MNNGRIMVTRVVAAIEPIPVSWLWPDRIARGFLNLLAGPPGAGKSTCLYDLAARVSREGGAVLIATAEDHLAAVVRPRLEAADADLDRIHVVIDDLSLPADVERLEARARDLGVVLVTVDPMVAFLDGGIDSHKDASVRQALKPLSAMAERLAAAVVAVLHTNKSASDDPLFRISGSVGFQGAARHVLLACTDPSDETGARRVLAVVKSNLAPCPPPLAYTITATEIPAVAGPITTSRICWGEEIPGLDPRSLLARSDREERGAHEEAAEFLRDALAEGPRPAGELVREATKAGISERTLQRVRRDLGIRTRKQGRGGWIWEPPQDATPRRHPSVGALASSVSPGQTPLLPTEDAKAPDTRDDGGYDEQLAVLADAFGGTLDDREAAEAAAFARDWTEDARRRAEGDT